MSSATPQSTDLSRRTLVRGAAWATPVLVAASSAPALSASPPTTPCAPTTTQWSSGGTLPGISTSWTTISPTKTGRLDTHNKKLFQLSNGIHSGQNWIGMDQYGDNRNGQRITLTFPTDVYCLTFYVTDIDAATTAPLLHTDDYIDKVTVSTSGTATLTATPLNAQHITTSGSGSTVTAQSSHTPSRQTYDWNNYTSTNGTVKFTSAGPVRSLTLSYQNVGWRAGTTYNDQQVYISPFTYSTTPCVC